jgi:hypothetical protein
VAAAVLTSPAAAGAAELTPLVAAVVSVLPAAQKVAGREHASVASEP